MEDERKQEQSVIVLQLHEEQVKQIRMALLILGVSTNPALSVGALNEEYVNQKPLGPHTQVGVQEWMEDWMKKIRTDTVPVFYGNNSVFAMRERQRKEDESSEKRDS